VFTPLSTRAPNIDGIIMHSETHEAASAADALVYAKGELSGVAARFGARG
jgi:hypothetical protein